VILGRLLRGLGVGAIAVLMMSSGMAGWLIVLEQFGVFSVHRARNQGQTGGKEGIPGIVPICYLN
jgi:hypothetical protein